MSFLSIETTLITEIFENNNKLLDLKNKTKAKCFYEMDQLRWITDQNILLNDCYMFSHFARSVFKMNELKEFIINKNEQKHSPIKVEKVLEFENF